MTNKNWFAIPLRKAKAYINLKAGTEGNQFVQAISILTNRQSYEAVGVKEGMSTHIQRAVVEDFLKVRRLWSKFIASDWPEGLTQKGQDTLEEYCELRRSVYRAFPNIEKLVYKTKAFKGRGKTVSSK